MRKSGEVVYGYLMLQWSSWGQYNEVNVATYGSTRGRLFFNPDLKQIMKVKKKYTAILNTKNCKSVK